MSDVGQTRGVSPQSSRLKVAGGRLKAEDGNATQVYQAILERRPAQINAQRSTLDAQLKEDRGQKTAAYAKATARQESQNPHLHPLRVGEAKSDVTV